MILKEKDCGDAEVNINNECSGIYNAETNLLKPACRECETFTGFCDPAEATNEEGCNGRMKKDGSYFAKCITCPGWLVIDLQ